MHVCWTVGSFLRTRVRKCHSTVASEGECGGVDGEKQEQQKWNRFPLSLDPVTTRVITTTTYLPGSQDGVGRGDGGGQIHSTVVAAAGFEWGGEWIGNARLFPSARNTATGKAGPR